MIFVCPSQLSLLMLSFLPCTVVNCIQCHPYDCVIATSGIDNTIKVGSIIYIYIYISIIYIYIYISWLDLYKKRWYLIRNGNLDVDLDSKFTGPFNCGWGSSRTRDCKCVRCYGGKSAQIMPHS